MQRPATKATTARYFSASSNVLVATTGSGVDIPLILVQDVASAGMGLSGPDSILIDDAGVYLFAYSISFFSAETDGFSNVSTSLIVSPSTTIPGSEAKSGAPNHTGALPLSTMALSCIHLLVGDGPFTVTFKANQDNSTRSTHRTLTAHRVAT